MRVLYKSKFYTYRQCAGIATKYSLRNRVGVSLLDFKLSNKKLKLSKIKITVKKSKKYKNSCEITIRYKEEY